MAQQHMGWGLLIGVVGAIAALGQPLAAQASIETVEEGMSGRVDESERPRLPSTHPATTVDEWLTQIAQATVQITGVRLETTEAGLQVVLETAGGELVAPTTRSLGNALIAEFPNAVLALPDGGEFTQASPAEGIALVTATNLADNTVQVSITGVDAPPTAAVSAGAEGLVLSVAPGIASADAEEEAIQVVVTGAQDEGYNPANASTATRTDTPLRDIPQSIQVVPRQVIEDQGVTRIGDALRNVSGVTPQVDFGNLNDRFSIRGFDTSRILINGFRSGDGFGTTVTVVPNVVERVEVLKGPASVLYGQVEPGGLINFVTEEPSRDPFYDLAFTAGSFGYIEPSLDISGPLTADERLTYRLNASYQNSDSFRDFVESEIIVVAPTLRYDFSDATSLTFEYQYLEQDQTPDEGLPIDPVVFDLPRERFLGEPDDLNENDIHRFFLTLNHEFTEDINLRSGFAAELSDNSLSAFRVFEFDPESGDTVRFFADRSTSSRNYSWQTDLISEFNTGSIEHQLLAGFELTQSNSSGNNFDIFDPENRPLRINIFDPQYGTPVPDNPNSIDDIDRTDSVLGIYLQDQISLLPNLKLLIGGRYDFYRGERDFEFVFDGEVFSDFNEIEDGAFSPRIGIVYQPIEPVSLYASYSRSFIPNIASTRDGDIIEPQRGTQYEVGVRADLASNLSANLAAYQITKTNILTTDPNDPDFSIPVGEVRSRGVELDVSGEILPGWNVIASAFINEAIVTEDNDLPTDDTLINAPGSGASLWTTYEIQDGDLQGLGLGAGLFYVGDREAELPNDLMLPAYVRADASIFYHRDNWGVQLNFKNLFDTRYFESSQNTNLVYPGAPFTVLGTISVRF